jgi:hypothetical protein
VLVAFLVVLFSRPILAGDDLILCERNTSPRNMFGWVRGEHAFSNVVTRNGIQRPSLKTKSGLPWEFTFSPVVAGAAKPADRMVVKYTDDRTNGICHEFRTVYGVPRTEPVRAADLSFSVSWSVLSPVMLIRLSPEGSASKAGLRITSGSGQGPQYLAFSAGGVKIKPLRSGGVIYDQAKDGPLNDNWMLLWSGQVGAAEADVPVLLALQKRPVEVRAVQNSNHGVSITISPAQTVAVITPFGDALLKPADTEKWAAKLPQEIVAGCLFWAHSALRFPIAYREQQKIVGSMLNVVDEYEYDEWRDDWGTSPIRIAPVPVLASFARKCGWPVKLSGTEIDTKYPAGEYGNLIAIPEAARVEYQAPLPAGRRLRGGNAYLQITDAEMARFANEWKGNVLRVGAEVPIMDAGPPYAIHEENLAKLDRVVQMAKANHIGVVISASLPRGEHGVLVDPAARQAAVGLWKRMAARYSGCGEEVAGYDLMSEPASLAPSALSGEELSRRWNALARDLTAAIRETDKTHAIIISGPDGGPDGLADVQPNGDSNTMYAFHMVLPRRLTCQGIQPESSATGPINVWYPGIIDGERWNQAALERAMLPAIRFMVKHRVPVFVGEFYCVRWVPDGSAYRYLADLLPLFEKYGFHWACDLYAGGDTRWKLQVGTDPFYAGDEPFDTDRVKLVKEYLGLNAPPAVAGP